MSAVTVHTSTSIRQCSEVGRIWLYYCLSGCCSAAGVRKKQLLLHNCTVKPLFSIILDCELHNGFWGSLREAHWDLSLQFCEKHMRADPLKEIILFAQQRKTKTANSDMQGFFPSGGKNARDASNTATRHFNFQPPKHSRGHFQSQSTQSAWGLKLTARQSPLFKAQVNKEEVWLKGTAPKKSAMLLTDG